MKHKLFNFAFFFGDYRRKEKSTFPSLARQLAKKKRRSVGRRPKPRHLLKKVDENFKTATSSRESKSAIATNEARGAAAVQKLSFFAFF